MFNYCNLCGNKYIKLFDFSYDNDKDVYKVCHKCLKLLKERNKEEKKENK